MQVRNESALENAMSVFLGTSRQVAIVMAFSEQIRLGLYRDFHTGHLWLDAHCWSLAMRELSKLNKAGRHERERRQLIDLMLSKAFDDIPIQAALACERKQKTPPERK